MYPGYLLEISWKLVKLDLLTPCINAKAYHLFFLSQSTRVKLLEEVQCTNRQPVKVTHWSHTLLAHYHTPEGRVIALFNIT